MGKQPIELPDIPSHAYLIEWLLELGPTWETGMGRVGLPHTEIDAWSRNLGINILPMEARWLHRLSVEYAIEIKRSRNTEALAPYREAPQESA